MKLNRMTPRTKSECWLPFRCSFLRVFVSDEAKSSFLKKMITIAYCNRNFTRKGVISSHCIEANLKKCMLLISLLVVSFLMAACGLGNGPEDNIEPGLYYIGNDELYEILNTEGDEGFFIYIGRPTCPMCQEFEPILNETLDDLEAALRYFQTDMARADDEDQMLLMLEALRITGVPIVVYIENRELRDFIMGVYTMEEVMNFFEYNGGL